MRVESEEAGTVSIPAPGDGAERVGGPLPAHRAGRRRPRAGGAWITRPPLLGEGGLDGLVEGRRVASGDSL